MMLSRTVDVDGPVHYLEYEGVSDGPTFVLVHALEGHHANWVGLAPLLAQQGRVLVPDLVGFGRTPLEQRSARLMDNVAYFERFLSLTTDAPVVLVGNSMGSAVSLLLARARPEAVAGLALLGPAIARSIRHGVDPLVVPIFGGTLVPRPVSAFFGRRIQPRGPEWFVRQMLMLCTLYPERVAPDIVDANVAMAAERLKMAWAPHAFTQAARSTMSFLAIQRRFWQMMLDVRTPVVLIGGVADRLVPIGCLHDAVRRRPDWDLEVLEAGHMPQLEDPAGTAEAITRWVDHRVRAA